MTSTAEKLDLDIGFSLTRPSNASVRIAGDLVLRASELPAVETMATVVRPGTNAESHTAFGTVGRWIEANRLRDRGPLPRGLPRTHHRRRPASRARMVEIQFPVRKAA